MKIRFESGDDQPLDKTFSISDMITVVQSVLEKEKVNIIHKFFYMNARISYKYVTVRKS